MSNYTKTTDFDVKDSLPSGDTGKIIRGSEFEVEFENIEVAIASKADSLNTVLTGNTSVTNLSVTGNTTLGNAASDTVTVNADFSSDLLPSADATYDLGAPGSEWQDLYVTGTANVDDLSCGTASFSANVTFGDNNKAIFGAGSDLQIYHDGSNSIIEDVGTGSLDLKGSAAVYIKAAGTDESMAAFVKDGGAFLYHNNVEKLETTASGVDVTGTVTADNGVFETASVVAQSANATFAVNVSGGTSLTSTFSQRAKSSNGANADTSMVVTGSGGEAIASWDFKADTTNGALTKIMTLDGNGDISFYEDTGTTPKFFWDASAESLGIGTTSPDSKVAIKGTSTTLGEGIKVYNSAGTFANNNAFIAFSGADSDGTFRESTASWVGCDSTTMSFRYGGSSWETATEHMVIDSSGNVGIGTSVPNATLKVQGPVDTATISTSSTPAARINNGAAISNWIGANGYNYGYIQSIQDDGTNNLKPLVLQPLGAGVGIGVTNPARALHVSDVMRLQPRATAPSSPSAGDIFFNSTTNKLQCYDGTAWQDCF